jgi:hypothetical protein
VVASHAHRGLILARCEGGTMGTQDGRCKPVAPPCNLDVGCDAATRADRPVARWSLQRKTGECLHPAEADMRPSRRGSGFDPEPT